MNATYIRARATAIRMVKKNGAQFPWRREVAGEYDPVTETDTDPQVMEQPVWAVILPPSGNVDQYRGSDGSLDLSKVRKILISPDVTFSPEPLDRIFHEGVWWVYENSMNINPDAEQDILFKGLIRRS